MSTWDARTGGGSVARSASALETGILDYVDSAVASVGGGALPVLTPFVLDVAAYLDDLLTAWEPSIDPTTQQWNQVAPLPDYWFLAAAPAAAGALYDRVISGWKWRTQAIATIEGAITARLQANGSLGQTALGDNTIDTMEFCKILATCLYTYGATLPVVTRTSWEDVLLGAAQYMRTSGAMLYYTNGNIEIGEHAFQRMAYKLTGDYTVGQYAEKAWRVAHNPEVEIHPSWAGWGYVYTGTPDPDVAPWDASALAATGYFTEQGGGGNGLDWDYTQYNASECALLYLFDREPRLVRLINLQLNTIWPRLNTTTWELNTMGGTRQGFAAPTTPRPITFDTPALIVANELFGRTGLADHEDQFYSSGNGSISTLYGPAVGHISTAPGVFRGSYHQLGVFLNYAAGL